MSDYLIIGDAEMTGLSVVEDNLLEIAFVIADPLFNIVSKGSWLWPSAVGAERSQQMYAKANDFVRKMHTNNGLWQDLYSGDTTKTYHEVTQEIVCYFAQLGISKNSKTELCGRNPNFDLRFLEAQAPEIHALFSYQSIDICSFQRFVGRTYGRSAEYKYDSGKPHRALDDCLNELQELKYYRDNFMIKI